MSITTKNTTLYSAPLLTKKMVYTALMTALVFVSTYAIQIRVPFTGGYIHLGDSMVFLSGLLLGPFFGAFAAGVGSAFADLLGGYTMWIIPTLIIKSIMAFVVGIIIHHTHHKLRTYASIAFSSLWIIFTAIMFIIVKNTSQGSAFFLKALSGLSEEADMIMESSELLNLLSKTSTYLLLILIGVPIVIALLLYIQKKQKKAIPIYISISYILSGTLMVIGYFVAYGIIVNNFMVPIFSIPSNMLQFIGGFFIAIFLTPVVLYIKKGLQPN